MPAVTAGSSVTALRAALACQWPTLRRAAQIVIRRALKAPTFGAAAEQLGVPRRALERLREDYPDAFTVPASPRQRSRAG